MNNTIKSVLLGLSVGLIVGSLGGVAVARVNLANAKPVIPENVIQLELQVDMQTKAVDAFIIRSAQGEDSLPLDRNIAQPLPFRNGVFFFGWQAPQSQVPNTTE